MANTVPGIRTTHGLRPLVVSRSYCPPSTATNELLCAAGCSNNRLSEHLMHMASASRTFANRCDVILVNRAPLQAYWCDREQTRGSLLDHCCNRGPLGSDDLGLR